MWMKCDVKDVWCEMLGEVRKARNSGSPKTFSIFLKVSSATAQTTGVHYGVTE